MQKKSIIFLGTPEFCIPSLNILNKTVEYELKLIITKKDTKDFRKNKLIESPVKKFALENNLNIYQPQSINSTESYNLIKEISPDYIVVIAYGEIISKSILNLPKFIPINVHASLLPKYRGSSPIQNVLLNGDNFTGISIQKIVKELDAGDILLQKKLNIGLDDTYEILSKKLSVLASSMLLKALDPNIIPIPQNVLDVSYCKKIKKIDGYVYFKKESALDIYNKYRAYHLWPGIYTKINNRFLKFKEIKYIDNVSIKEKPGNIHTSDNKRYFIQCKTGIIELIKIQIEGKKEMDIETFFRGFKQSITLE